MWCPNCKNEYVAGITRCVDCGVDLVEVLPSDDPDSEFQYYDTNPTDQVPNETVKPFHAYVSKRTKKEDMKSTAYSFTLIGIAGIILLILFLAGVFPVETAIHTKIMSGIVMGGMFLIFLCVGLHSFSQIKQLDKEADCEEDTYAKIIEWFRSTYTASDIDAEVNLEQPEEMLYFSRYEIMGRFIQESFGDLEESFLDHIIEDLYSEFF